MIKMYVKPCIFQMRGCNLHFMVTCSSSIHSHAALMNMNESWQYYNYFFLGASNRQRTLIYFGQFSLQE